MTDFPFDDRGLAYGDGVFETVLVRHGQPLLWQAHKRRLTLGCERLGFQAPDDAVLEALREKLPVEGDHILKIIVTRGSGGRGYCPPAMPEPRVAFRVFPFAPHPTHAQMGVTVRCCSLRLAEQPRLAGIKHLNRLENVLARQEWQDTRYAEGLLCDQAGRVVEATAMNVFWQEDDQWYTPSTERCGVTGTLALALVESGAVQVAELSEAALSAVTALCVGNSVQGLWPVVALHDSKGSIVSRYAVTSNVRALQHTAERLLSAC